MTTKGPTVSCLSRETWRLTSLSQPSLAIDSTVHIEPDPTTDTIWVGTWRTRSPIAIFGDER